MKKGTVTWLLLTAYGSYSFLEGTAWDRLNGGGKIVLCLVQLVLYTALFLRIER